jgi:hypothetical protein
MMIYPSIPSLASQYRETVPVKRGEHARRDFINITALTEYTRLNVKYSRVV